MRDASRILVATDFSAAARIALQSARALAGRAGGALALVHVLEPLPPRYRMLIERFGTPDLERLRREGAGKALARDVARARTAGGFPESFLREGKPWYEILETAREWRADAICLGNSGRSRLERLLLGSTVENVVRHSALPLLITRTRPLTKVDRVLLPVDFDEGSEAAIRFAVDNLPKRSRLEALFVLPPPLPLDPYGIVLDGREKTIGRDLRAFLRRHGAGRAHGRVILWGDAAAEILRAARRERADLVILSTHGRRGIPRTLMGSVAEKVVRYADRPVLVLPPPGRGPGVARAPRKALGLGGEADRPAGGRDSRGRTAGRARASEAWESRLRAKTRRPGGRGWAPQAHTGRAGPPGRRGSGQTRRKARGDAS
jgi:nucleotide-binding universal stress UspA family protein